MKAKLVHATLTSILVTSLLFIAIQTSSSGEYDPWIDSNDDGEIDIFDAINLAAAFGTSGNPINKTNLLLSLNATVADLEARLDLEVGRIHVPPGENGTICATRSGGCVLRWDGGNFDFLLDNTSVDWLDYWYINKGAYAQGAIISGTTGHTLIDWTPLNDNAAEIHFGQADGPGGYCSVWVQYANGVLVGHYMKY